MRKLMIALVVATTMILGAACTSNTNHSDSWSAPQKAELRRGLVLGYETSGLTPSNEMTECMTNYVVSHFSYKEVTGFTSNPSKAYKVGTDTAMYCLKQGITG